MRNAPIYSTDRPLEHASAPKRTQACWSTTSFAGSPFDSSTCVMHCSCKKKTEIGSRGGASTDQRPATTLKRFLHEPWRFRCVYFSGNTDVQTSHDLCARSRRSCTPRRQLIRHRGGGQRTARLSYLCIQADQLGPLQPARDQGPGSLGKLTAGPWRKEGGHPPRAGAPSRRDSHCRHLILL